MENKEIYIDGVNVWSCKHYDIENNYCDQSYLGEGGLLKNTQNPKRCECSPNCYYKQLKRLERENAELKDLNEEASKIIEYKNGTIASLAKIRDELKQKLEGCTNSYGELYGRANRLAFEHATYKQALEEIREIAKREYDKFIIEKDFHESDACIWVIIRKINEVLNKGAEE